MAFLRMTMIDVGWGDSIFLEADDTNGDIHYALIDSNDTPSYASSRIFLKRYFEKNNVQRTGGSRIFDFMILSHNHSDHGQGLKTLMRDFGTEDFFYSKSNQPGTLANLMSFANRSSNVGHNEAIDTSSTKPLPDFGQAKLTLLWPPQNTIDDDENNNSLVLLLKLSEVSFVLTGDAEETVWDNIKSRLPIDTKVFKVPHHGSENGFFKSNGDPNWLGQFPNNRPIMAISSHIKPFHHPHSNVIQALEDNGYKSAEGYYRTDEHFHISFETDGNKNKDITVKYWH